MTAYRRRLAVTLPFVFLGACGVDDEQVGGGEDVVRINEGLYISQDVTLFTANGWQVPVCFAGGLQEARDDVRNAIESTWEQWTRLSFTGWGQCPSSTPSPMVPIELVADNTNSSCGGGVARPGMGGRLTGSTFQMRINYCPDRRGLRSTAVHEMGHVLGLLHEHQRQDRGAEVAACEAAFVATFPSGTTFQFGKLTGGYYGSAYDSRSIMNYCRDWNRNGTPDHLEVADRPWDLSTQDFFAIQQLYGWYDPGFDMPAAAFAFLANLTATAVNSEDQHSWHSWGRVQTLITRESTGTYRVDFSRLAATGGNFQVSAFNSNNRCKINDWSSSGTTQQLRVKCRTPSGTLANTQFTARYLRRFETQGWDAGFVYADQPTTASYTAPANYSYNSAGFLNTVTRRALGQYRVNLQGQAGVVGDRGTPEVTAVGTGSEYCSILSQDSDDDGGQDVDVKCYTTSGSAVDTRFMLSYGHRSLVGTHSFATINSVNAAATHTPSSSNQKNFNLNNCTTAPGPSTITRLGLGRYEVNFKRMWTSSASTDFHGRSTVKVTAWDLVGAGAYCNPMAWTAGVDTKVTVNCYTPSGAAVDARFSASLGTTYTGNCN